MNIVTKIRVNSLSNSLCALMPLWICPFSSTNVEDSLQINLFLQNKPNFRKAKMNVSIYHTKAYKNETAFRRVKNKPNSNPNKPNCQNGKIDAKCVLTKDYRKKDDFSVRINKPNFRNGQNERKLNYNKGLQKKRLFSHPKNKPNSNPIKANLKRNEFNFCATGYYDSKPAFAANNPRLEFTTAGSFRARFATPGG